MLNDPRSSLLVYKIQGTGWCKTLLINFVTYTQVGLDDRIWLNGQLFTILVLQIVSVSRSASINLP